MRKTRTTAEAGLRLVRWQDPGFGRGFCFWGDMAEAIAEVMWER